MPALMEFRDEGGCVHRMEANPTGGQAGKVCAGIRCRRRVWPVNGLIRRMQELCSKECVMTKCEIKRKKRVGLHTEVSTIFHGVMLPEKPRKLVSTGEDKATQKALRADLHPVAFIGEPGGLIDMVARQRRRQASIWYRLRRTLHRYATYFFPRP